MDRYDFLRAFWRSYFEKGSWPESHIGSPEENFAHVPKGEVGTYLDFDKRLGLGFRPTACVIPTKDRLQAELSTNNRSGIAFVEHIKTFQKEIESRTGLTIDPVTHATDAKIQIVWDNANLECRALWPAHFQWLTSGLEFLATEFLERIRSYEDD